MQKKRTKEGLNVLHVLTYKPSRRRLLLASVFGGLLAFSAVASAADSTDTRIEKLDQTVQALEAELKALKSERSSQGTQQLIDRVDEIEEAVFDVSERIGSREVINAFEGMSVDIGGFLHSTFTTADGEDSSAQSYNRNVFELLVRADFNKNWSAFIAQAFIRESDVNFDDPGQRRDPSFRQVSKTPQVIAWSNYKYNDALNVQFGRFITPHGIINIEHFPAILLDTEQPLFLRPFGGQTIFPNFVSGAQIHGKKFTDSGDSLHYNFYVAEFAGNNDDLIAGGRAAYTFDKLGVTIGVNASNGDRSVGTSSEYEMLGVDVLIDKGKLLWKTEYFSTDEDSGRDREAYYTQPAWRISDRWTAFYRYDFLDNGAGSGDQTENMLGVNYTPQANIRLRLTYAQREIEAGTTFFDDDSDATTADVAFSAAEADVDILQLSATLSF